MIVIGFDLSLSDTGWAVLEVINEMNYSLIKSGHIATHLTKGGRRYSTGSRLSKIDKQIRHILETYPPDFVAKESSFSNGNNRSTQQIYKVNGVFELIVHQSEAKTFKEYAPNTIKKVMTGNGHSSKEEVARKVQELTGVKTTNDNITDAIAVAFTHAMQAGLVTI